MPDGALIIGGAIVLSTILSIVTRERVKTFMGSSELTEGESYIVKATTTNISFKAGVPVAAILTINIVAVVNSQVIMEDSEVYEFAAEEIHTFEFPMTIPVGTGGKVGAVYTEVLDPSGNKLADGSLDIEIQTVVIPTFTFSNVSAEMVINIGAPAWMTMNFDCRITNPTTQTLTRTLKVMRKFLTDSVVKWEGEITEVRFSLTLAPGQSYDYHFEGNYQKDSEWKAYLIIARRTTHCIWLEDEAGNKSEEACVYRA